MREIDCSNLPEPIAKSVLEVAEKKVSEYPHNTNGVNVLQTTKLVVINGDDRHTLRLYGILRTAMNNKVREMIDNNRSSYTKEEIENYLTNGIECRNI